MTLPYSPTVAHQPTATERTADAALVRRAEAVDD